MKHILVDSENDINADPKNPSGELLYYIYEIAPDENEADVIQYVHDVSPTFLIFPVTNVGSWLPNTRLGQIYRLAPRVRWKIPDAIVTVSYGAIDAQAAPAAGGQNPATQPTPNDEELGPEWDIDITVGTQHITQLDERMLGGRKFMERRYAKMLNAAGATIDAPTLNGIIGLGKDRVEGVDVRTAATAITVTMKGIPATKNYVKYLRGMVLTVNSESLTQGNFNAAAEEMLFTGAKLRHRPGDGWVGTYTFEQKDNLTDVNVGGVILPHVKGFDHVWCTYKDAVITSVEGKQVKGQKPHMVFCDRMYLPANHAGLFVAVP